MAIRSQVVGQWWSLNKMLGLLGMMFLCSHRCAVGESDGQACKAWMLLLGSRAEVGARRLTVNGTPLRFLHNHRKLW